MPLQLQGVTLEGIGAGPPRVSEADAHLADQSTGLAGNARNRENNDRCPATDGQRLEPPLNPARG